MADSSHFIVWPPGNADDYEAGDPRIPDTLVSGDGSAVSGVIAYPVGAWVRVKAIQAAVFVKISSSASDTPGVDYYIPAETYEDFKITEFPSYVHAVSVSGSSAFYVQSYQNGFSG